MKDLIGIARQMIMGKTSFFIYLFLNFTYICNNIEIHVLLIIMTIMILLFYF